MDMIIVLIHPDKFINQYGRQLLGIIKLREGGITFNRGEQISKYDWRLRNKFLLPIVKMFNISHNCIKISDHITI